MFCVIDVYWRGLTNFKNIHSDKHAKEWIMDKVIM